MIQMNTNAQTRLLTIALLIGLISLFCLSRASAQEVPEALVKQIESLTETQNQINQKIQETQQTLSSISARGRTLNQEIGRLEASLKQANLGIQSSENQIRKLQLEIQLLEHDIEAQELAIASRREMAGSLLRNLQVKDGEGLLLTLLKSQSLAESVSESQVFEDINKDLLAEVGKLRELRVSLGNELEALTGKKLGVEVKNQTLKVQKEVAQDQKEEQANLLAKTKSEEAKYQATLTELEKQQQQVSDAIEEIEDKLRAAQNPELLPTKRSGVLGWPTAEPYITQEYGATAFAQRAYKSKFHNGTDFRARPIGQPIYAAEDGVIFAVGDNGRVQYGRHIVIRHNNGLSTLYAHLSKQVVGEGDSVKRGDLIGYSGNTGYSMAPHLHFVVYTSTTVRLQSFAGAGLVPVGSTLNPMDYLPSL